MSQLCLSLSPSCCIVNDGPLYTHIRCLFKYQPQLTLRLSVFKQRLSSPAHIIVTAYVRACGPIHEIGVRRILYAYLDSIFLSMSSRRVRTGTPYLAASHTVEQARALSSALARSVAAAASSCLDLRACKEPNAEENAPSNAVCVDLAQIKPFVHASLSGVAGGRGRGGLGRDFRIVVDVVVMLLYRLYLELR